MGIDFTVETENGSVLRRLPDPRGNLTIYIEVAVLDKTTCLQYIDPYGDTVFNGSQMPILLSEFQSTINSLSEERLLKIREHRLAGAIEAEWQDSIIDSIRKSIGTRETRIRQLAEVHSHIEEVVVGIEYAITELPHVYVKFRGD
jgi:hypothetical protein